MKLADLIGLRISDILVKHIPEPYGLDQAEIFLVLENNKIIAIPFHADDDEVWEKEMDNSAKSIFKKMTWWEKQNQIVLPLKDCKIIDVISYPGYEADKSFILLDNNNLITEVTTAPSGTGHTGLWRYESLDEVTKKFGDKYIRLSELRQDK